MNKWTVKKSRKAICQNDVEADVIKDATIVTQNCAAWTQHRNGQLTASLFYDVFVRKPTTNLKPLIKKIMRYEQNDLSHVPAIRWGFKVSVARDYSMPASYLLNMTTLHVV